MPSNEDLKCPECDGKWRVYWDETKGSPMVAHTDPVCEHWLTCKLIASAIWIGEPAL